MSWVPLSGYDNGMEVSDKPRRLTDEEILYIVGYLPLPPSADEEAAIVSREGVVEWMTETLKDIVLCPSAIPELIERILEQHYKSLAIPGTAIGTAAAESVGATTTQMTLNTFHTSGSAKSASFGIDAMRDIIFARKNPKNESCTIRYVNKRASYEEILNSRQYIVGSMISDFVKDYDIDSPNNFKEKFWWSETIPMLFNKDVSEATLVLRLYLNIDEMFRQKVTISELASTLEREAPPKVIPIYGPISDGIIDIYPDLKFVRETVKNKSQESLIVDDMIELTFFETMIYPELSSIRVKGISGIKQLYPIVAPVWSMVSYERKMTLGDLKNEEMVSLLKSHIGNAWMLYYNRSVMKSTGLIPENLSALCTDAGLKIIVGLTRITQGEQVDDRLVVDMPDDRFVTGNSDVVIQVDGSFYRSIAEVVTIENVMYRVVQNNLVKPTQDGWIEEIDEEDKTKITEFVSTNQMMNVDGIFYRKLDPNNILKLEENFYEKITNSKIKVEELEPSKYVSGKIAAAKRKYKDMLKTEMDEKIEEAKSFPEEKRKRFLRTKSKLLKPDILNSCEYIYSETDGSNLRGVLSLPQIDKTRTTCNNMHVIAETLGIEATRTFLIRALYNTITNTGSYIHPANILFIAEFMTGRGIPYGATFTGISRGAGGHLSLATLERAGKVFIQNAVHGRKEDIRNVSASVAVGSRMTIGDGMFDIAQNIEDKTIINDDLFKAKSEPVQNISPNDIMDELNELKSLKTVGDIFDHVGNDEETNLYTAFTGEGIVDISLARKTKSTHINQPVTEKISSPPELIPILDTVKIARNSMKDSVPEQKYEPPITMNIKSAGLVSVENIIPGIISEGLPEQLSDLLHKYTTEAQELLELPTVHFKRIVGPSSLIELRKEQVKDLIPATKQ